MNAAGLIASLVTLERSAAKEGDLATRALVIEMQEWVLRVQRENLELRRENQALRRQVESMRAETEAGEHDDLFATAGRSSDGRSLARSYAGRSSEPSYV